jgi:hypothetical protein
MPAEEFTPWLSVLNAEPMPPARPAYAVSFQLPARQEDKPNRDGNDAESGDQNRSPKARTAPHHAFILMASHQLA